jgi:hypothetical protein
MVALSALSPVIVESTLFKAVRAAERVQEAFDQTMVDCSI